MSHNFAYPIGFWLWRGAAVQFWRTIFYIWDLEVALFDVASDLSLPIGQIVGGRKPEMYLLQLIA
jgi:hypothetical protein